MTEYTFINNKYRTWYNNIIIIARERKLAIDVYTEKHHIIPRCLGGTDETKNLVALTAREHFVCHRLLTKITEGKSKRKMCYAMWRIINGSNRYVPSSRTYEALRKQISKETVGLSYEERYGTERATEIKRKIGEKSKGRQAMLGKKHSAETKRKISLANSGRPLPKTEETKKKMSETWGKIAPDHKGSNNPHFGKKHSEESKRKMSISHTGKKIGPYPTIECPHCNKIGSVNNMKRWHFDNCKYVEKCND